MAFWKKLSLHKKEKKRAVTQPQATPMPWGEYHFRMFMHPESHRNRSFQASLTDLLTQECLTAEMGAKSCRTPIATQPRRYLGIMPQPDPSQPLDEGSEWISDWVDMCLTVDVQFVGDGRPRCHTI